MQYRLMVQIWYHFRQICQMTSAVLIFNFETRVRYTRNNRKPMDSVYKKIRTFARLYQDLDRIEGQ